MRHVSTGWLRTDTRRPSYILILLYTTDGGNHAVKFHEGNGFAGDGGPNVYTYNTTYHAREELEDQRAEALLRTHGISETLESILKRRFQ